MRSPEDARRWWLELDRFSTLSELKDSVKVTSTGYPRTTGLRSVWWKAFLLFETLDRTTWAGTLAASRAAYDSLRAHFLRAIEHPDEVESAVDPLSDIKESPWALLRQDEALRAEIFQDVERCMPDNVYFRQPSTQNILLDVLFVFAKLNPDVGYRQGMHELLAPILWVVERDAVDTDRYSQMAKEPGDEVLLEIFDSRYIEHDAFTLFGLVMQNAKSFYEPGAQPRVGAKASLMAPHAESPMLVRCKRIFEGYLPMVDPALAAHLTVIGILPQLFLMRWIRVLFGREFPFNEALLLWDLLFAEDTTLELVDHICVAMLLRLRQRLIKADNSAVLQLLNHYPEQPVSQRPQTFVQDALYLRQHLDTDGANYILTKHSQRPVPLVNRLEQSNLVQFPSNNISYSSRPMTPVSKLPDRPGTLPSGLEALLQGAARDLYTRGEKWGVNQAIRDAVDEVKKNVQGLQSPGIGPLTSSASEGVEVLKKVEALEQRNKELGKMLTSAVAELWDYHKQQVEEKKNEDGSLRALSLAIARVQFVQVYLEDASIPLLAEDQATAPGNGTLDAAGAVPLRSSSPVIKTPARPSRATRYRQTKVSSLSQPATPPSPSQTPSAPPDPPIVIATLPSEQQQPTLYAVSTTATPRQPAPPTAASKPSTSASVPAAAKPLSTTAKPTTLPTRPPIAQSSFSWMLGQDSPSPSSNSHSSFIAASPFQPEKRRGVAVGKSFLFGEEDDEGDGGGGSKKRGMARGKGKSADEEEDKGEVFDLGTLRRGEGR